MPDPEQNSIDADWIAVSAMLRRLVNQKRWLCIVMMATIAAVSYYGTQMLKDQPAPPWGWQNWLIICGLALTGGLAGVPFWNAIMAAQLSRVRTNLLAGGLAGRLVTDQLERWLIWNADRPGVARGNTGGRSEQLNSLSLAYEKLARESGIGTFASAGCLTVTVSGMLVVVVLLLTLILGESKLPSADISLAQVMQLCQILPGGLMACIATVNLARASANAAVAQALSEAIDNGSAFTSAY